MLPEELGSQFLMKLQENGESYYLMKGKQYMDRMISLLRCCYKSLEIALEDYSPQQTVPGVATVTAKLARPLRVGNGGMSVNMFNVDMCPPSCAALPAAPVPRSPKKRRRKRKRGSRVCALAGIEERVKKLEDELKQVRLQLACQERWILELESKTMRPEGSDRAARTLERNPPGPASTGKVNSTQQTVVGRKGVDLAAESGDSKSDDPDQESQAQVSRPAQVKRKRRSRKRKRGNKNIQEDQTGPNILALAGERPGRHSLVNLDHRNLPGGRVSNEGGEPAPGAECTTLTSRGGGAFAPSTETAQEPMAGTGAGFTARNRKYTVLYAQKTPLNHAPRVAGVDPMTLLQFAIVIEMWKTRLIPVLIWIMQHLKN
jgi:hypothetical protein